MRLERPGRRPKVVIDTNIIFSAAVSRNGAPAAIFQYMIEERIQNFTSKEIIDEVIRVFNRPNSIKEIQSSFREHIINGYLQVSSFVRPSSRLSIVEQDASDNKFLEVALEAKADCIISGDKHLRSLREFRGMKILGPAEFLKVFHSE